MAHLVEFKKEEIFKSGYITLIGSSGLKYIHPALLVPGYGWIPCSQRLQKDYTRKSTDLLLVINNDKNDRVYVTSDRWITRKDWVVVRTLNII